MSEREGSQRERGTQGERIGSQRERGATRAGRLAAPRGGAGMGGEPASLAEEWEQWPI